MLTFEDVLLVPGYSDINSRADIDLSTNFLGYDLKLPIISANMDYVTDSMMAEAMLKNGAFYVLHRFYDTHQHYYDDIDGMVLGGKPISISTGVDKRDNFNLIEHISRFGGGIKDLMTVTVDVAHGHHRLVADMIRKLKDFGIERVIAGNVATVEGYRFLADAGANAIKVGIGPGSVCTTRDVAGVGVPQIGVLMEINEYRQRQKSASHWGKDRIPARAVWVADDDNHLRPMDPYYLPPIIADGGIKSSGDIVKALAAGADMVMLGSLLAATKEAPGERVRGMDGKNYKRYRGQSIFGTNGSQYTPEGIEGWVEENGPVEGVLKTLAAGIRSGMSYVGARNLNELRQKAEFVQVTHAGYSIESATRVRESI